jgi:hypothetical protein
MGMSPYLRGIRAVLGPQLLVMPSVTGIVFDAGGGILLVRQRDVDCGALREGRWTRWNRQRTRWSERSGKKPAYSVAAFAKHLNDSKQAKTGDVPTGADRILPPRADNRLRPWQRRLWMMCHHPM